MQEKELVKPWKFYLQKMTIAFFNKYVYCALKHTAQFKTYGPPNEVRHFRYSQNSVQAHRKFSDSFYNLRERERVCLATPLTHYLSFLFILFFMKNNIIKDKFQIWNSSKKIFVLRPSFWTYLDSRVKAFCSQLFTSYFLLDIIMREYNKRHIRACMHPMDPDIELDQNCNWSNSTN